MGMDQRARQASGFHPVKVDWAYQSPRYAYGCQGRDQTAGEENGVRNTDQMEILT